MDSITQATLGAAVGEAILGKKLGNRALAWGLLFGTLPDLDILASPLLDTARRLEFHRGASHSLLIILLASLLLAKPLAKLWKREKISPTRAGTFVLLVWLTHVLIDCFTVYGTSVLWPFSETRIAFNNLFIIDPLYTLPLLIATISLAFYRTKKLQKKRTRILTWGLTLSTGYIAITFGLKSLASSAFEADLTRRNITYLRRMEAPTPLNTLLWRSVLDRGDEMWVGYHSILQPPSTPIHWTIYPKENHSLTPFEHHREIKTLQWFSRGWWIARPHAKGIWLADLRFGESRIYGEKPGTVDSRFMFSWSFNPHAERDRLRTGTRTIPDTKDTLRRLGLRILGRTDSWEAASPRLAGVPGTLPQPLSVIAD